MQLASIGTELAFKKNILASIGAVHCTVLAEPPISSTELHLTNFYDFGTKRKLVKSITKLSLRIIDIFTCVENPAPISDRNSDESSDHKNNFF